jgi:protein gp37
MGDLFHDKVPFEFIDKVYMRASFCKQHMFLILTKRIERAAEYHKRRTRVENNRRAKIEWPIPNIHLGVTVCNQKEADEKIPILLQIPATYRWLSIEPMLGPINLNDCFVMVRCPLCGNIDSVDNYDVLGADEGCLFCNNCHEEVEPDDLPEIDWVVVGCESGPNRRECKPEWIKSIVDQCKAAGVKCYVKQMEINGKVVTDLKSMPPWAVQEIVE